ncbi:MAG TPA: HEAT repeat domain-containing protein [Bryobacteraceae bacterium]|jgi:HEAT repeat protein
MKIAIGLVLVLPLLAVTADLPGTMLDKKLTAAQRNNACFALRGDASQEAIEAETKGLRDVKVRACSAENLRRAKAVEPLKAAITDENPDVRAIAARMLGTFERPELAPLIAKAGDDPQMLVATNAIEGLSYYRDRTAVPYFLVLAKHTGIVGSLAIEQLIKLNEPRALDLGRELVKSGDPADLLAAMRILGSMGNRGDIPSLEDVAKRFPDPLSTSAGRGFGLMPAINLARAARTSIEQIRAR